MFCTRLLISIGWQMRGMSKEVIPCQVELPHNSYRITGKWLATGVVAVDNAQLDFSVGNAEAVAERG